jgi:hypothetical protein
LIDYLAREHAIESKNHTQKHNNKAKKLSRDALIRDLNCIVLYWARRREQRRAEDIIPVQDREVPEEVYTSLLGR